MDDRGHDLDPEQGHDLTQGSRPRPKVKGQSCDQVTNKQEWLRLLYVYKYLPFAFYTNSQASASSRSWPRPQGRDFDLKVETLSKGCDLDTRSKVKVVTQ